MAVLTTSGAYDFSQTAADIIAAALRITQTINEDETPTGAQLINSLAAMNAMVKGWGVSGIHLWAEEEAILFPQPGQTLYRIGAASSDHATLYNDLEMTTLSADAATGATTLHLEDASGFAVGFHIGLQIDTGVNFWTTVATTPGGNAVTIADALPGPMTASANQIVFGYATPLGRPLRCYTGRRFIYASQIENPMIGMAMSDYQSLPNKQNEGTITQYFFNPQTGDGVYSAPLAQLNLWPSPQDYFSGFRATFQRPLQDMNLANLPDLPVEWNVALKWNLAQEIGPELGTPTDQMQTINQMAGTWFSRIQMWDREPQGVKFGVSMQPGFRHR